jgi:hypothetical protein
MSFTSDQSHVTSLDETAVASYRGVSVLAVLTLILGLASALALAHPFLWVLPPATLVIGWLALRAIGVEGSNLTGRGLALLGMALAMVFGVWAPAQILTRQAKIYAQARVFADEWLELIRAGKLHAAHQLAVMEIERQTPGTDLEKYYQESAAAKSQLQHFYEEKPLKLMAEQGTLATYEYLGGDGISPREQTTEHIALLYLMRYPEDGREREQKIRIVLDRQELVGHREYLWHLRAVNDPNRVE